MILNLKNKKFNLDFFVKGKSIGLAKIQFRYTPTVPISSRMAYKISPKDQTIEICK